MNMNIRKAILFLLVVFSFFVVSFENVVFAGDKCLGWIGIDSGNVTGANIELDGRKLHKRTPHTIKDVPCGEHSVLVSKPMYKSVKIKVKVSSEDVVKVHAKLKANFGSLEILTNPGGALVLIDGKESGKTPLKLEQVQAGQHTVEARLPDYETMERKVVIKTGKSMVIQQKMLPDFGQLEVSAGGVAGALVVLDGDELGQAPMTLKRVVAGKHTVKVIADFYKPFKKKIVVKRGKLNKLKAILKPAFGTLSVHTRPSGGLIFIDGKRQGTAPSIIKLSPGIHEILATDPQPGHKPVKAKVKIRLGAKQELVLKMPVKTGAVMINSVPFGAKIEIDGKKRGSAPLSIKSIPVGVHVLLARAKGFDPLHGRIEIVEGKRSEVEMNLKQPSKSVYKVPQVHNKALVRKSEKKPVQVREPKTKSITKAKSGLKHEKTKAVVKNTFSNKNVTKESEKKMPSYLPEKAEEQEVDTEKSAREAAGMSVQRWSAWITGAVAVATLITSGAMFTTGLVKMSEADDAYNKFLKDQTTANEKAYKDLDDRAALFLNVGWGMLGGAALLGGVSVVLFLTEPEPEVDVTGPSDGFSLSPVPGGVFGTYTVRF